MEDRFYIRTKKLVELVNCFEYPEYLLVFWKYNYEDDSETYEIFIDVEKKDEEPKIISFILTYNEITGLDNCYENLYKEIRKQI